jgi:hypothetical protein
LVHIDFSKTPYVFKKVRRNFNYLAEFIEYVYGNVKCRLISTVDLADDKVIENYDKKSNRFDLTKPIIIPVFYSKYLCEDYKSIPKTYKDYFL